MDIRYSRSLSFNKRTKIKPFQKLPLSKIYPLYFKISFNFTIIFNKVMQKRSNGKEYKNI